MGDKNRRVGMGRGVVWPKTLYHTVLVPFHFHFLVLIALPFMSLKEGLNLFPL